MKLGTWLALAVLTAAATACGGGGGDGGVAAPASVTSTGSGSDTGATPSGASGGTGSTPTGTGNTPTGTGTSPPTGTPTSSQPNGTANPAGGSASPPATDTSGSPATGGGSNPPSGGTPPTGSTPDDGQSTPPAPPTAFTAGITQAPPDGATIAGTIRLEIGGTGIQNVELLPATGYAPLYARGVVTGDNISAYIDLDTTVLPDGPITLRIAAFNAPPGAGGSEITAMPPRTWTIQNAAPAPQFAATLITAPRQNAFLGSSPYSSPVDFTVIGSNLGNVELVSARDESVVYGRFTISPDKTVATLSWDFYQYLYGSYSLRIIAWDTPPGQPGQRIDLETRNYTVLLPRACQGEGTCGMPAP